MYRVVYQSEVNASVWVVWGITFPSYTVAKWKVGEFTSRGVEAFVATEEEIKENGIDATVEHWRKLAV